MEASGTDVEARTLDEVTAESRAEDPHAREDYEPKFSRDSYTRRVLAFTTDQEDSTATPEPGAVPRNTPFAIMWSMRTDHPGKTEENVHDELLKLVEAGMVQQRDDGTFALTDDGHVELKN
jgi:hypothetical protein